MAIWSRKTPDMTFDMTSDVRPTYVRHTSDIRPTYVRHTSDIRPTYVRHTSEAHWTCIIHRFHRLQCMCWSIELSFDSFDRVC